MKLTSLLAVSSSLGCTLALRNCVSREYRILIPRRGFQSSVITLFGSLKRPGSLVDSYRTLDIKCSTCRSTLFQYKKKNGKKSGLAKLFIERIARDYFDMIPTLIDERSKEATPYNEKDLKKGNMKMQKASEQLEQSTENEPAHLSHLTYTPGVECSCPKCSTCVGRVATVKGRPCIKIIGGRLVY